MPTTERDDRQDRRAASPDAPPALDLPAAFGKYFLTEKLATGGMAEIYLAKLVGPGGFEKQLVIKQIHPRLSGQRHFVDLFVAEAKTLVTLAHGNIVPVYELGVIDDTYFIAMEYIDGPTLYRLTELLRRHEVRMAPAVAAWITARVLEGLDYAHRKGDGVIHRDLSPRNVMLSRDGEVKLVDFGIAVTLGDASDAAAGESAPTGSFPYMSPEQVRKEPLTGQTDLFSVGVLLWEMLAGHRLFARPDPDATLRAVVAGEIARPSAERPEIPGRLDEVVMRALERDRAARWATASDMLGALQRYLYSLDDMPGPRDAAALVARYCPPEARRQPTHLDELADDGAPGGTRPRAWRAGTALAGEPRPGPATAVIPRDGASARGKRSGRPRTETFATHVALERMFDPAAPPRPAVAPAPATAAPAAAADVATRPVPRGAAGESDAVLRADATPRPRAARIDEHSQAMLAIGEAAPPTAALRTAQLPPLAVPGRSAPSSGLLVAAALGALALGGAAIYAFYQGRGAVLRSDELPHASAPAIGARSPAAATGAASGSPPAATEAASGSPPAATEAASGSPPAATGSPPTATEAASGSPPAGTAHTGASLPAGTEAGRRSRPTGTETTHRSPSPDTATAPPVATATARAPTARRSDAAPSPTDPAAPRPAGSAASASRSTGTATLTVGAIPWGTVLLDGKPIGRTPIDRLAVPAGHHVVTVTFGGEDPPRTQSYPVELAAGGTRELVADFTQP